VVGRLEPGKPAPSARTYFELIPFSTIDEDDVRRAGETSLEALRRRAAHAGPIDDDTQVYRIEFHALP
jgi:hypothetical protein